MERLKLDALALRAIARHSLGYDTLPANIEVGLAGVAREAGEV